MEQHIDQKYPIFPRKTIYINPNFKMPQSPHINPLFIYSNVNIHMNPQFLRKKPCDHVEKCEDEQCKIKSIDSEHVDGSKKVIKSLRVVHELAAQRTEKFSDSIIPNRPLLYSTKRKLVRIDNTGRFTNSAATTQNMSTPYKNSRFAVGKYKVDNRIARPLPKKISYEHINMSKRNLRLLNINGVLYKTTPNKLQRKDATKGTGAIRTAKYLSSHIATTKMAFGSIFGKSVPTFNNSITYTSASPKKREQCVRCSVKQLNSFGNHTSQGHLYHAKQRSLQILRNRLVKSNIPCAIFQRLGKCIAFERGKCRKVHDKIQVAICPRFLRGECNRPVCLLSHNVSLSKMPVCKYFLQGVCVRMDCPYLHKKLSRKAKICEDFLQGFCSLAEQCDKRHEFACHILQHHGKCEHPSCAYHKIGNMKLQIRRRDQELTGISLKTVVTQNKPAEESAMHRYFDGKTIDGNAGCAPISEEIGSAKSEEKAKTRNLSANVIRPKLGALPPFISLTEAS